MYFKFGGKGNKKQAHSDIRSTRCDLTGSCIDREPPHRLANACRVPAHNFKLLKGIFNV